MHVAAKGSDLETTAHGECLQVFEKEFDYLHRTLRRLGVHESDVQDLCQEVFLVVYRRWEDYDPSRSLRAWLFGITFRVASSHKKRRGREVPHAWLEAEGVVPEPDQELQRKQDRALILQALQSLPLPRRAVFTMHDIDQIAIREIAEMLSIPLFTAYSRLRKGRKEFEAAVRALQAGGRP